MSYIEYRGRRKEGEFLVDKVWQFDGEPRMIEQLNPRLDLRNHSPTGFSWGYAGSGPSQLALAILADALEDDQRALRLYQEFKQAVIATVPPDAEWIMTKGTVLQTAATIEEAMTAAPPNSVSSTLDLADPKTREEALAKVAGTLSAILRGVPDAEREEVIDMLPFCHGCWRELAPAESCHCENDE